MKNHSHRERIKIKFIPSVKISDILRKVMNMISFEPLWRTLKEKGLKKGGLQKSAQLSSATFAKMAKNESVTLDVIDRVCRELKVSINQVVTIADDSAGN